MKNVLFGKLGQTIIFDRDNPLAIRSNTNGNYEAYNMLRMLLTLPINVFVAEDNIIISLEQQEKYENLFLVAEAIPKIDCGLILLGVDKANISQTLLNAINTGIEWYALATDPRCLTAMSDAVNNPPEEIYAGAEHLGCFMGGKHFETKYLNLEAANVYKESRICDYDAKHNTLVVVANETKTWDRIGNVKKMVSCLPNNLVRIYGRYENKECDARFKGEKSLQFIYNEQRLSRATYVAPIENGWITAKYIECIYRGVIPIMSNLYGWSVRQFVDDIEKVDPHLFVSTPEAFAAMWGFTTDIKSYYESIMHKLQSMVLEKYSPEMLIKRLWGIIK